MERKSDIYMRRLLSLLSKLNRRLIQNITFDCIVAIDNIIIFNEIRELEHFKIPQSAFLASPSPGANTHTAPTIFKSFAPATGM